MRRLFAALILAITSLGASSGAFAAPSQVIIIRHGEKPDTGNELNERGWQRANALVGFFQQNSSVTQHGAPAAIYAMAPKGASGSLRPIQTVTPLAQSLGLTINSNYTKKQLLQLVSDILADPSYEGRTVLICWEHKVIPELVRDFGWDLAPQEWPGGVFDRAWLLSFSGERVVSFLDIPEHVLPGDSAD